MSEARDPKPGEVEPDALYDPALVIFVFGAWVFATWFLSELMALGALVVATACLTVYALRRPGSDRFRTFVSDFGVILMFCAMAIGIGVLVLAGLAERPAATLVALAASVVVSAGIVAAHHLGRRRHPPSST